MIIDEIMVQSIVVTIAIIASTRVNTKNNSRLEFFASKNEIHSFQKITVVCADGKSLLIAVNIKLEKGKSGLNELEITYPEPPWNAYPFTDEEEKSLPYESWMGR